MASKNESVKTAPSGIFALIAYIFSFILPVIGVIAGMTYIGKEHVDDKKYGKICLGLAVAGFIALAVLYSLAGEIVVEKQTGFTK